MLLVIKDICKKDSLPPAPQNTIIFGYKPVNI